MRLHHEDLAGDRQVAGRRLTLGQLYIRLKRPTDAFKVLGEVPETATQYLEAQLNAGMAYWQAYIDGATAPEGERPPKETLDNYQAEARRILETAVKRLDEKKAKDQPSDENVSFAKTSLVQILNLSGKYPEALAYLVEGRKPWSPPCRSRTRRPVPPRGSPAVPSPSMSIASCSAPTSVCSNWKKLAPR